MFRVRHVVTAQEFNRNPSAAARAAEEGPVTITKRGEPYQVLMSVEAASQVGRSALDVLADDGEGAGIEFDPEPMVFHPRIPDFG
jgi:prevent-host-death family protein